jgi:hypothetical protein
MFYVGSCLSSVLWNGTQSTHPKNIPTLFQLLDIQGQRSSGRLQKRGLDLYNFLTEKKMCSWRLNWLEEI